MKTMTRPNTSQTEVYPLRTHCVSVRLNPDELRRLDRVRGSLRRGQAVRMLSFSNLPEPVPELNKQAWVELSRAASNLNQLAHRANYEKVEIDSVRSILAEFRAALIGEQAEAA